METAPVPDVWADRLRKDDILRVLFDSILAGLQPDIICDVGCFNGDETARFLKLVNGGKVVAFEADKNNYNNFIMPRPDVVGAMIENVGIAEIDGETTFHPLSDEGDDSNWLRAAGSLRERTDGIDSTAVTIPVRRLDSYFADDLDKTFMLWIDVEGALDRVLAGAEQVLTRTLVLRCEVERHQFWEDQLLADHFISHFEERGFMLLGDSFEPNAHPQSDLLFLNRNWLNLKNERERAKTAA